MKAVCGYSLTEDAAAAAIYRQNGSATLALLAFGYGTMPDRELVCQSAIEQSVQICVSEFTQSADKILGMEAADINFASSEIQAALQKATSRIYKAACLLGQGIYVGGVACCVLETNYLLIPFGGAVCCLFDGTALELLNMEYANPKLISDALGSREYCAFRPITGSVRAGQSLYLLSDSLPDTHLPIRELWESHIDTASQVLWQELTKTSAVPAAAMEIKLLDSEVGA